jgi:hypothetical protein
MEDDLSILKVKYLSNHVFDHTQILNLEEISEEILSVALLSQAFFSYFLPGRLCILHFSWTQEEKEVHLPPQLLLGYQSWM